MNIEKTFRIALASAVASLLLLTTSCSSPEQKPDIVTTGLPDKVQLPGHKVPHAYYEAVPNSRLINRDEECGGPFVSNCPTSVFKTHLEYVPGQTLNLDSMIASLFPGHRVIREEVVGSGTVASNSGQAVAQATQPASWPLLHQLVDKIYNWKFWDLILVILALLGLIWLIDRWLNRRRLAREDRARLNLIDNQVQALRTDVTNGFARLNAPHIPTPDTSVTSVTTSHTPETLDVGDGKTHFKASADRFHYPIIVTSTTTDADGKKQIHEMVIGSGKYQTPTDAGSTSATPPAPAAPPAQG